MGQAEQLELNLPLLSEEATKSLLHKVASVAQFLGRHYDELREPGMPLSSWPIDHHFTYGDLSIDYVFCGDFAEL